MIMFFFEGELDDLGIVFSEFDLLLITSREDSIPLVGIEAGRLGIPIVCFKSASGLAGLVENEKCGIVVDYLDTESMADSIAMYVNNKDQYAEHSKNAKKVFFQFKHNQKDKSIETILKQVINNQS
jgi:glycosyltransferase involved in cell wall biosynthesis